MNRRYKDEVAAPRTWLVIVAGLAAAAAVGSALASSGLTGLEPPGRRSPRVPDAGSGWPAAGAPLGVTLPEFPSGFGVRRVYLDAGHGAPGNPGNTSSLCVAEQDFTLAAALALGDRLEATGHFDVRISREGDALVEYRDRIADAEGWGAEAFLSLHSDVRGVTQARAPSAGRTCLVSTGAAGFSVLVSDEDGEGDPPGLRASRQVLARATARAMRRAGFAPYDGVEYAGLYEPDAAELGVFMDRHAMEQRIFVLRRPSMPSILIETHNARDAREAERWDEPRTLDAFAAAIAAAIVDALSTGG